MKVATLVLLMLAAVGCGSGRVSAHGKLSGSVSGSGSGLLSKGATASCTEPDPAAPLAVYGWDPGSRAKIATTAVDGTVVVRYERTGCDVLLEVLDSLWKDHLRGMDQLRDGISFRAFSQLDPRVEFKKEGSRLFKEMQQLVRERVTDYIFKMRLATQNPAPAAPRPAPAPARTAAAPVGLGGGSMIAGPGLDGA